jgi:hypothetical protein
VVEQEAAVTRSSRFASALWRSWPVLAQSLT